jgi:hypothetical protein
MILTISDQSVSFSRFGKPRMAQINVIDRSDRSVEYCESLKVLLSSTPKKAKIVEDAKTVVPIPGSNRGVGFETARQPGSKGITARRLREKVQ